MCLHGPLLQEARQKGMDMMTQPAGVHPLRTQLRPTDHALSSCIEQSSHSEVISPRVPFVLSCRGLKDHNGTKGGLSFATMRHGYPCITEDPTTIIIHLEHNALHTDMPDLHQRIRPLRYGVFGRSGCEDDGRLHPTGPLQC